MVRIVEQFECTKAEKASSPLCLDCKYAKDAPEEEVIEENSMLVSVVIASRDEGERVKETVKSIVATSTEPLEIVIVDDASTDGSCNNLEQLSTENAAIYVVHTNKAMGVGAARNLGLFATTGRVVAVVDAHMSFPAGCFHEMAKYAIKINGIVVPCVETMSGSAQGCGADMFWHKDKRVGVKYHGGSEETPTQVDAIIGACYVFPRSILNRLQRWPASMGIWGYDEEALAMWAWMQDIPIHNYPKVHVKHLFRSEMKNGVFWGSPTSKDILLNELEISARIYDKTTYKTLCLEKEQKLPEKHRKKLQLLKEGGAYSDSTRTVRTAGDLLEHLHVPAKINKQGHVEELKALSVIIAADNLDISAAQTVISCLKQTRNEYEIIVSYREDQEVSEFSTLVNKRLNNRDQNKLKRMLKFTKANTENKVANGIQAAKGDIVVVVMSGTRHISFAGIETLAAKAWYTNSITTPKIFSGSEEDIAYMAKLESVDNIGIANIPIRVEDNQLRKTTGFFEAMCAISKDTLEKLGGWPDCYGYVSQWLAVRAYFLAVNIYCMGEVTAIGYIPQYTALPKAMYAPAHKMHYIHFNDDTYKTLKALLPEVDIDLSQYQPAREEFAGIKQGSDKRFLVDTTRRTTGGTT
jgi:hypothetical protein